MTTQITILMLLTFGATACDQPAAGPGHEDAALGMPSDDDPDAEPAPEPSVQPEESAPLCDADEHVSNLPFAAAWREQSDEGVEMLRIHFQSFEVSCADVGDFVPEGEARVRIRVPHVAGEVDLEPADAVAILRPRAPGNPGSINTLAFLDGRLELDVLDDRLVGGMLRVDGLPFAGCFQARLCPGA